MSVSELADVLSPLTTELQLINDNLQLVNSLLAGVILFLGVIFGGIFIGYLWRRF